MANPERRTLGRTRLRWEGNIKRTIKKWDGRMWTAFAW
jgi:hypothetical protein